MHHAGLWGLFVSGTVVLAAGEPGAYGAVGARLLAALDVGLFVFFVLSGYLIARPFVHAFIEGRSAPGALDYARRRALRIVPAFWFVAALAIARHGSLGSGPSELAAVFGFMQTFHHGGREVGQAIGQAWTLHVEAGFYLLVPLCGLAVVRLGRRLSPDARVAWVVLLALAVAAVSLTLRQVLPQTQPVLRSVPTVVFAFMPGVALAALESRAGALRPSPERARLAAAGLLLAGLGLAVMYGWQRDGGAAASGLLAGGAATAVVAGPLVMQWWGAGAWRALDNRPMRWLGERSYSFYLVHNLVLWEVALLVGHGGGAKAALVPLLLVGLAGSLAASALLYRFVERPFLRVRSRRRALEPAPAVAPATYPSS